MDEHIARLRRQIATTRSQLKKLTRQLTEAERQQSNRSNESYAYLNQNSESSPSPERSSPVDISPKWPLQAEEYKRYGRQMVLPHIGLQGQLRLKEASVLIIGLGGLGSPAAAYLAGAGVGTIGLVDPDIVDMSNLHRQILHTTSRLRHRKLDSALEYLQDLNPLLTYRAHSGRLRPGEAVELFEQYDLILDCTDGPTSRYLISDAAVLTGKPLVSASALGMEGQLLVLNDHFPGHGDQPGRFCYRCVFPKPPPPQTIYSCAENGVLGPVVGVMGVLMATSALKLIVRGIDSSAGPSSNSIFEAPSQPSMLLYSSTSDPMFRTVKIKGKRPDCISCSSKATISAGTLTEDHYVAFCGVRGPRDMDASHQRFSPEGFVELRRWTPPGRCVLIDVRPPTEFGLAKIEGSINVPLEELKRAASLGWFLRKRLHGFLPWTYPDGEPSQQDLGFWEKTHVFTVCRHGNDSQVAAQMLEDYYGCPVKDIAGGLDGWRERVDPTFPEY
ncbi:MAG: hypothetical protein Q9216_002355 [Gyalolechia sp. 2 TL-2023]